MNQSLNDSNILSNGVADKPESRILIGNFRANMQTHTNVKRIDNFNMNDDINMSEQPKTEQPKIE